MQEENPLSNQPDMATEFFVKKGLRVAIEGCGHGTLNSIYASIKKSCELKGWNGVDLLIIGGDFQAVRNAYDMNTISMPAKYRELGDFHEYYSGKREAPYLTLFVGGNHEASNYLWELYYGGWVAPKIFYMGAANVIRVGPLRIAGLSGIWKGYDYKKPHHERLPYNRDDVKTIYHVREIDTAKLLQIRTQIDIGISHDWPRAIEWSGDWKRLFRIKKDFEAESKDGTLGSVAARYVIDHLRPAYWFSAHMHIKFAATEDWEKKDAEKTSSSDQRSSMKGKPSLPVSSHPKSDKSDDDPDIAVRNEEEIDLDLEDDETATAQVPRNQITDQAATRVSTGTDSEAVTVTGTGSDQMLEETHNADATTNSSAVINEDEIDLDLDEEGESETRKRKRSGGEDIPQQGLDEETKSAQDATAVENANGSTSASAGPVSSVSEELRALLPAAFSRPAARENSPGPQDVPRPRGITNKKTYFLALDKCLPNRDFLQILDIEPVSEPVPPISESPEPSDPSTDISISYDKEWLAITRVFAADQPPSTSPFTTLPPKRPHAEYELLITEQESWVEETIVKTKRLAIPQNFQITAPVYDAALGDRIDGMPREYPNPQTQAFCELLQIQNHFTATEEEIQARIDAGPKPESERSARGGGFSRGRGGGGGGRGGHHHHQNQNQGGRRGPPRGGHKNRGGGHGGHGRGRGRGGGNPNHSAVGQGRGWT